MKMMEKSTLTVIAMVITLSSVNGQHPPPPYNPEACIANFTGVCRYPSTSADLARCCVFWSDLMKNEDQHPCICSLFVISNFTYEYALGYLLDCQVNVTGFNFCPDLRGSPKLPPPTPRGKILQSPPPPPAYNVTRKPPPLKPQETPPPKTAKSLVVVIAVCSVVVLVLVVMLFKFMQQCKPSAEGQKKNTFTFEELVEATGDFSDENFLGRGGFAFVYKGFLKNGRVVAVKRLMIVGEEGEREFRHEIEMIGGLPPHKHVVSLIGHCITPQRRILVYEFVPNGSLYSQLHGKKDTLNDWSIRMKIAIGSARGIAYLHEPKQEGHPTIIHRDIKSANILLDENYMAKIADFGLSKWKPDDETHIDTRVIGTHGYLAPEYHATGQVTPMADIYSFGAVIVELITGHSINKLYIDWVRPFLLGSLKDQKYHAFADPRLNGVYDCNEMARMVACAASCIQPNAKLRQPMSLIILVLEGRVSVNALNIDMSISCSSSEGQDSEYSGTTTKNFTWSSLEGHAEEGRLYN